MDGGHRKSLSLRQTRIAAQARVDQSLKVSPR